MTGGPVARLKDQSGAVLLDCPCDASVFVGAVVKFNASSVCINAQADNHANSNAVGIVERKKSSTLCDVRLGGISGAIFSSLDPTKDYFLSDITAGLITDSPPTSGTDKIILRVGRPKSATELAILFSTRIELDDN